MRTIQLSAFVDELEKISAGPRMIEEPELAQHGIPALYVPPRATLPGQDALRKRHGLSASESFIVHAPKANFPDPRDYRASRRHELTHWLRDKRGKVEGVGMPGLKNVAKTIREEVAANRSALKPFRKQLSIPQRARYYINNTMQSLRSAYPRGLLRAVLGKG